MRRPTVMGWAAQLGCGSMVKELEEGRAKLAFENHARRSSVWQVLRMTCSRSQVGFVSFELYHPLII